ncbi:hypothetical protein G6F59_012559 [Rhizopus arrhizus]|nr:hypothetical protein G6F59_012559 [Rhizopus arrhizus]
MPGEPAAQPDLQFPLVAIAPVPGPDRRARRVRHALPERALAPGDARQQFWRNGNHAAGPGPDRRGHDLEPAGDGDRGRLRDLRVPPASAEPSGSARMAEPRQRQRAEGEAGDGDHRHLLHPPAEDLHRQWRTEWHPTVHAGADERGRRQHRDRPLLDADP